MAVLHLSAKGPRAALLAVDLKRHSAVEPMIGKIKADHRMSKTTLKVFQATALP